MIKAIIFDFGGVLSVPGKIDAFCEGYAKKLNKDPKEFLELVKENWHSARINKIPSKTFWVNSAKFLEVDSKKFRGEMINSFRFQEDIFTLIKKLKKDYKIGLLSDQIEDWLEETIKEKRLNKIFDAIVTSYKSKIAKPDIRIFKEIVKKLKIKPTECIYIDDLEINRAPAKKLGMKFILFKNKDYLMRELKKLKIRM